jgi:peptide/nickel transport system ATP-binding protein
MLPLLDIQNLSIDFVDGDQRVEAVKNISFSVNRGEIVAVVGESGSGKTVTALSILQLLPSPPAKYVSGKILFSPGGEKSQDLLQLHTEELYRVRGNDIGMIFQEPMSSLNPVYSCGYQVAEAIRRHRRVSKKIAREKTLEWFAKVKLPQPDRIYNSYPHQLSGGQKQRVMIAMAMCCDPSLLVCDEPTTALDVTVQKNILELIRELALKQQIGVIFITHDLGVVAEVANSAVVMYRGEVVEKKSVIEIFNHPAHPYTKGLLACRPVLHKKGERLPVVSDFLSMDKNVSTPILQPVNIVRPTNEILLSVEHLSVWFPVQRNIFGKAKDFVKAVDDVSFPVYKGETLGLVGESGCGKTTLGRAILGLQPVTSGKIIFENRDLSSLSSSAMREQRKEIQIVFQDPFSSLNPRVTIGQAIAEPLKVHEGLGTKERTERVMELLEKVDLRPEHFNRYPHEFSGGQRQRIVIARALILHPSFVVCDESVSALDVSVQAQVLNLLNDLKNELGFTVIFISHDLSVVRYISDRIMVMHKGRIVESGSSEEVYFHPREDYTKMLVNSIPGKMAVQ